MFTPTLAGFIAWVRSAMGITTAQLPDDSVFFGYAFAVAMELTNVRIQIASPPIYQLAVYNLGGDNLINWAQDPNGAPVNSEGLACFAALRKEFGIFNFTAGPVSSSGDEGSNVSLEVVEGLKNLLVGQLQNLKTPYGRVYISFTQAGGNDMGIT